MRNLTVNNNVNKHVIFLLLNQYIYDRNLQFQSYVTPCMATLLRRLSPQHQCFYDLTSVCRILLIEIGTPHASLAQAPRKTWHRVQGAWTCSKAIRGIVRKVREHAEMNS